MTASKSKCDNAKNEEQTSPKNVRKKKSNDAGAKKKKIREIDSIDDKNEEEEEEENGGDETFYDDVCSNGAGDSHDGAPTPIKPRSKRAGTRNDAARKNAFLHELTKSLGCALAACQKTGVARSECETWLQEDAEFAEKVHAIAEDALDYVEGKMFEKIKNGDARLIKFYLESKGKKRGYGKTETASKKKEEEDDKHNAPIAFLTEDEMMY